MKKIFGKSGVSMILLSITMVAILGFAALVIDVGNTMYEKQKLANAIDAATLAGMAKIDGSDSDIINAVRQYAQLNGVDPDTVSVTIAPDRKTIHVSSNKSVDYFFARVLGINRGNVDAQVGALTAPITGISGGARPLAIEDQTLNIGQQYVLKDDACGGYCGNYGAIALGGSGATVYRNNLEYGYNGYLKVGDVVNTETGNMAGPTRTGVQQLIDADPYATYTNFRQDSPRVITILIVDSLDVTGRSPVTIKGFAAFFLEGLQGHGGHAEVVGRFVNYVGSGDCGETQTDYGLKAVKLTN